jgi:hypothetical protein
MFSFRLLQRPYQLECRKSRDDLRRSGSREIGDARDVIRVRVSDGNGEERFPESFDLPVEALLSVSVSVASIATTPLALSTTYAFANRPPSPEE